VLVPDDEESLVLPEEFEGSVGVGVGVGLLSSGRVQVTCVLCPAVTV
jgi:hypothetical protein